MPQMAHCRRVMAVLAWIAATVAVSPAAAQTNTAEIAGVVRDATGGVLPGAVVIASQPSTGATLQRVTDAQGRFYLPALQIGVWDITVTMPGFVQQVRRGLMLELGRTVSLDITMMVEGLAEQIVVQSTAPLLQNTTAEISDVIGNRDVVQVPLNARTLLSLAQLSDGVVLPPGGTRGDALQQAGPLPNVGGQRSGHNIYLLDGVKITDELFNNLALNPAVDSVQEFKLQKSMYPAEFGGKASALINVATKAGTNQLHGTGFEFFRDNVFDSRNYFQPASEPVPALRQNQFGGTLGGPVVRDHTFLFGSYEGLRLRRSLTRTFSVPSPAIRQGDFSGLATICDPLTVAGTGVCAPFSANRIPAGRIDPIASAFLRHVPAATAPGNVQNLAASEEQRRDSDQFTIRLDHRFAGGDQLFARVSTFDADETQPFGTSVLQETLVPGFGRSLRTTTRTAAASHTHVFGQAIVHEFRAGWMRVSGGQVSDNQGDPFSSLAGLAGVTTDPRDMGFPQISTGGLFSTMGDPALFTTRDNRNVELYDNVTIDRGVHRIKIGAYYFHLALRPEQPDNARGTFTYTGQFSGNAFADFLLGYPTSATVGIGRGHEDGRTNWLHLYAQDDWRIRDNLTLNLGLRYELNQHMYDVNNRLSSVDLSYPGGRFVVASDDGGVLDASAAALLPVIPLPVVSSADAGWNRGLLDPSWVRLAPRTGFALSLNDDRAVIRGGYSVFLNQWAYSVQTAFAHNLPFFFAKQVDVPVDVRIPTLQTGDILASSNTGAIGASIMDHDYNVEYSQTWSGGLQLALGSSTMAEVSYMGTWTIGADNATVRNVPEPGPGPIQPRRPIPALNRINAIRFDGRSIYHGVTLRLNRRLDDNLAYNVSYTLSQSKDDASSPGPTESEANVPQNVRNVFDERGEWARSSFDHRHQVVASAVYGIPYPPAGRLGALLSGWRVNAIAAIQSGAPFTVNLATDHANVGAGPAQRPDQSGDPNLTGGDRAPTRWFDVDAFALPGPFTFGSAPRNSVIGPGYANIDLVLARTWLVAARRSLELRWEVFNLFNRTNFDLPNRVFGNPNFGRIFSAKDPRQMQFGARLTF
jgi:hypothetical protein